MTPEVSERPPSFVEGAMVVLMCSTWALVSATALACCVPIALVSLLPEGPTAPGT
jgi:hypothetical protein